MSQSEALTPVLFNTTLTDADTEYSQALPVGTKHFSFQCRTAFDVRFSFEDGKVATPTAPYATVKSGDSFSAPEKVGFSWNTDEAAAATIYWASAQAGVVVELIVWKDIRAA